MCMLCDDEKAYQAYMNYLDEDGAAGQGCRSRMSPSMPCSTRSRPQRMPPPRKKTTRPTTRPCLRSSAARSINDRFDIADARRGPQGSRDKTFTSLELTDAHLDRDRGGARAQCLRAGDARSGARHGARPDAQDRQGRGRPARRHSARHQGSVRDQGRAHHGVLEDPRQFRAALRVDRHLAAVARRRGDARQAQQ